MFVSAILAAGGKGTRMGADRNKIFLMLAGRPVLAHTVEAFEVCRRVDEIVLAAGEDDIFDCKAIAEEYGFGKVKVIVKGGETRQESVANALAQTDERADIVLVHDAARPLVTPAEIDAVIAGAERFGACAVGTPLKNTVKQVDARGFIVGTPERESLREIQTPQGFAKSLLLRAYENARLKELAGTDDCFLAERVGAQIPVIEGSWENIKLTTPEDLFLAERILMGR
jgi:2-C-methyl-D-erythritol 4-phosphate cytidylyltransferase